MSPSSMDVTSFLDIFQWNVLRVYKGLSPWGYHWDSHDTSKHELEFTNLTYCKGFYTEIDASSPNLLHIVLVMYAFSHSYEREQAIYLVKPFPRTSFILPQWRNMVSSTCDPLSILKLLWAFRSSATTKCSPENNTRFYKPIHHSKQDATGEHQPQKQ